MQTKNEVVDEVERLWAAYREHTAQQRQRYPARRVLEAVATAHGVTLAEMHSLSRRRAFCHARHHAAWELRRRRHDLGLLQVAYHLGRTDHTTALHSYQTFARMASQGLYAEERAKVEELLCTSL